MFCNKCGQGLTEGTAVCPNCGNVLTTNSAGVNTPTRLKSTFNGGSSRTPYVAASSEPIDVNKTYRMPVEFETVHVPTSAPEPTYAAPKDYGAPVFSAESSSSGYSPSASAPSYAAYSYDTPGYERSIAKPKKGVGGRITRSILVSILFMLILFGPVYGDNGGLFPRTFDNAFEKILDVERRINDMGNLIDRGRGDLVLACMTQLVAFIMLMISTIGSFISGLCNGKGAVRAFSVLGIVSIALYVTHLFMLAGMGNADPSKYLASVFDIETGILHIGTYISFVIFIVNCAIASKD